MHRLTPALLGLLVLPLATACGGAGNHSAANETPTAPSSATATTSADGVQQITIDTTDQFRFAPMTIRAHVGRLRIMLSDHGTYPHNISFPSLHATSPTVSGNPGQQQTTFTVTFTHAGTYDFICTFHSSAGMKGQVTVS